MTEPLAEQELHLPFKTREHKPPVLFAHIRFLLCEETSYPIMFFLFLL